MPRGDGSLMDGSHSSSAPPPHVLLALLLLLPAQGPAAALAAGRPHAPREDGSPEADFAACDSPTPPALAFHFFDPEDVAGGYYIALGPREGSEESTRLFDGGEIAVFANKRWYKARPSSEDSGTLVLRTQEKVNGSDPILGEYYGVELWFFGTTRNSSSSGSELEVVLTAKSYASDSGSAVAFTVRFPNGANGTSTFLHGNGTIASTLVQWPVLNAPGNGPGLQNTLSWEGSFMPAKVNEGPGRGREGGPTVFFDSSRLEEGPIIVVGPISGHFKDFSGSDPKANGPGPVWNGGISGTIDVVPENYTFETILFMRNLGAGLTETLSFYGEAVQARVKNSVGGEMRPTLGSDVTLDYMGYQTDNGAAYCFCDVSNCSDILVEKTKEMANDGVPIAWLSFQGSGASSGGRAAKAAPWCVDTWGVDGGLGPQYPMNLSDFQEALGVPLQLYAPYFCPHSPYFEKEDTFENFKKWPRVQSDMTLPGCDGFDFLDVDSEYSEKFYLDFFQRGKDVANMVSFEPDFMNQNTNCVREFIHNTGRVDMWQRGMGQAAEKLNLSVQWCYATPMDVFATVELPAVTNFRVSDDFCYGNSWNIGVSSFIPWILGKFPSKDTLWTSDNGGFEVPGCEWTPDHFNSGAELHVCLALLSTGPLAISDLISWTNYTLLSRTVNKGGKLLKPSKAITAVDSTFHQHDFPMGQVYGTFTKISSCLSWIFLSFQLKTEYPLASRDFFPPLMTTTTTEVLYYRSFNTPCANGSDAIESGCIREGFLKTSNKSKKSIILPASNFANISAGTDFAPSVTTVYPWCNRTSWIVIGELNKYVTLSSQRFGSIQCKETRVEMTLLGSPGESLTVTVLRKEEGKLLVQSKTAKIGGSGLAEVTFLQYRV